MNQLRGWLSWKLIMWAHRIAPEGRTEMTLVRPDGSKRRID